MRRTGGIAGGAVEATLDLASADPRAQQVRDLLARTDLTALGQSAGQPDRYVYAFRVHGREVQVPEQQLTPELSQIVGLVLEALRQ